MLKQRDSDLQFYHRVLKQKTNYKKENIELRSCSIDLVRDLRMCYNYLMNYTEYEFTKMPYGRYRGFFLKDLPEDYLRWCVINWQDQAMATMFATELQRRNPKLRR